MLTRAVHHLEEGFIALLLALMTVITFSQVVARYFFSTGFGWALELTTYLSVSYTHLTLPTNREV